MEECTMKHGHHLESPEEIQKITNNAQLAVQDHSCKTSDVKEYKNVKKHLLVYLIVPE
jgi:hypothetical protein